MTVLTTLQRLVFKRAGDKDPALYLRALQGTTEVLDAGALALGAGASVAFDTYFGMFSLAQWGGDTSAIRNWVVAVRGSGSVDIVLKSLTRDNAGDQLLLRQAMQLDGSVQTVDISASLAQTDDDVVYLEVHATSDAILHDLSFSTHTPPLRQAPVGLVMTTFRRPDAALQTIGRLTALIENDDEVHLGRLEFKVIDNGRDLADEPITKGAASIVPNPNNGGAGGFARGLSLFAEEGRVTHVTFMDDDANTEEECICRIRRFLAFVVDTNTAVTAAMLRSEETYMCHEQGALFEWGRNHRIISRKNGLDLTRRSQLYEMTRPEAIEYGGWWLFTFPLKPGLIYPFPMFVRGDDWLFSYLNRFKIVAINGVSSWQEGFENKISPTEQYLAIKAFLVAELMLRDPVDIAGTVRFFATWLTRNVAGYCYDRAACGALAIEDVLAGPDFWAARPSLESRFADLRALVSEEKHRPLVELDKSQRSQPVRSTNPLRQLSRLVTLNGHLLPSAACKTNGSVLIEREVAPDTSGVFRWNSVTYASRNDGKFFVARRNPLRAAKLLGRIALLLFRLAVNYRSLRTAYLNSVGHLCTKEWWDAANLRQNPTRP